MRAMGWAAVALLIGACSASAQINVGLPTDGGIGIGITLGGMAALEPGAAWPALGHDGTRGGSSLAVGPSSGRALWFVSLGGAVGAPVISNDGTIFVGSSNGMMNALNCGGKVLWQFNAGGPVLGAPVVTPNGSLVFATTDGTLFGLRHDGAKMWARVLGAGVAGSVAPMSDGSYAVVTVDGQTHLFRADGTDVADETMASPDDGPIGGGPVGSLATGPDGTLYGATPSEVWAFQATGGVRWRFRPAQGTVATGPAVGADGTVYVGVASASSSLLVAVDAATGTSLWTLPGPPPPLADAPAVAPDGSAILAGAGQVVAANPDGSPRWTFATENGLPATGTPAVDSQGTVYFSVSQHGLHAVTRDGQERWVAVDLDTLDSAPALGLDGTLYFPTGPLSQTLFALGPGGTNAGDLNGDGHVNVADATLALRMAVGIQMATPEQIAHGDITPTPGLHGRPYGGKGKITVADAVKILGHSLGLNQGCAWP